MDYTNPNVPPVPPAVDDVTKGKTVAILSYCTLIGWIIAIILHQSDKTKFGAYHLRQALGLFIIGVGSAIVISILGWLLFFLFFLIPFINIGMLVLLIIGIINAANGQTKPLPLIGELSNKMLSGIQ